jgi:hypothetical protein
MNINDNIRIKTNIKKWFNRVNILKRLKHACNYLFIYKDQDNNSRIAEVQTLYNKDNLL